MSLSQNYKRNGCLTASQHLGGRGGGGIVLDFSPFYTRRHEPRHSERTHTWELPF